MQPELPPRLAEGWSALTELGTQLAELQAAAGLPLSPEDYLREVLHPGLMQVRRRAVDGATRAGGFAVGLRALRGQA